MAIEGIGATITKDASAIGEVIDINLPDDSVKEYETTVLSDTREQFAMSAMSVGQEFSLTIRLNPETPAVTKGASGVYVITLPLQTAGNSGATYTFTAFTRDVTGGTAATSGSEGITQDVTYRLTTEVVFVAEA
jgi:hypothetical protein